MSKIELSKKQKKKYDKTILSEEEKREILKKALGGKEEGILFFYYPVLKINTYKLASTYQFHQVVTYVLNQNIEEKNKQEKSVVPISHQKYQWCYYVNIKK